MYLNGADYKFSNVVFKCGSCCCCRHSNKHNTLNEIFNWLILVYRLIWWRFCFFFSFLPSLLSFPSVFFFLFVVCCYRCARCVWVFIFIFDWKMPKTRVHGYVQNGRYYQRSSRTFGLINWTLCRRFASLNPVSISVFGFSLPHRIFRQKVPAQPQYRFSFQR